MLNQFVRKRGPLAHLAEVPSEHQRFAKFTPEVAKQLYVLEHWNWSSVAPKAMRVGLGFICIIVGLQKTLTLFFVWFIAIVAYTPPGATVAIFIATGTVRPLRHAPPRINPFIADVSSAGAPGLDSVDGWRAAVPRGRSCHHRRVQPALRLLGRCWHCRCGDHRHEGHRRLCAPRVPWRGALKNLPA
jgi:hypothetical protein